MEPGLTKLLQKQNGAVFCHTWYVLNRSIYLVNSIILNAVICVQQKVKTKCCYIFPSHLINASTLPCETENTEIVSFHVNLAC